MINFNECYITKDGKYLVIDVRIPDSITSVINCEDKDGNPTTSTEVISLEDVYLDSISYESSDTYGGDSGPSGSATIVYADDGTTHYRTKRIVVSIDGLGIDNKLIFITVVLGGTIPDNLPCGIKSSTSRTGVVYNKYQLCKEGLKYINNIDSCTVDNKFINYMLKLKYLDLAIYCSHYSAAIEIWNKLFLNTASTTTVKTCSCHG